jgi:sulfur carrier protein
MRILLNDEPRDTDSATLADLLAELGLREERGVAAAVDGAVVPRGAWSQTRLAPGTQILVIRAAQGG